MTPLTKEQAELSALCDENERLVNKIHADAKLLMDCANALEATSEKLKIAEEALDKIDADMVGDEFLHQEQCHGENCNCVRVAAREALSKIRGES